MEQSSDFKKALGVALKILSKRDRSEFQVRELLSEFDNQTIARVINYLKEKGFINDKRFAESYYQSKKRKRWGSLKIKLSLKQLGIADEIIDSVTKDIYSYEKIAASALLKKRDKGNREKNIRFLLSRGFSYESIASLLKNSS